MMSLGAVTFSSNPAKITIPKQDKYNSDVITYSDIAYFSWGARIKGKKIQMSWPYMTASEFNSIDDLFIADESVTWDPDFGTSLAYDVEIIAFGGEYHLTTDPDTGGRRNIEMILLILDEA